MESEGLQVSNSAFLAELGKACPPGTVQWITGFKGHPDNAGPEWRGGVYDPAKHAKGVDDAEQDKLNAYTTPAALKYIDGKVERDKEHFARAIALVLDDVDPAEMRGDVSAVVRTSPATPDIPATDTEPAKPGDPAKFQVWIFLDGDDPDCENVKLLDALLQRLITVEGKTVDRSGNSITRYARMVGGVNGKRGDAPTVLTQWSPQVRVTLEDAAFAHGVDLDEIKKLLANKSAAPATASIERDGTQRERIEGWVNDLISGATLHDSINRIVASMWSTGMVEGAIYNWIEALCNLSRARFDREKDWLKRKNDAMRATRGAIKKFKQARRNDVVIDAQTGEIEQNPGRPALLLHMGTLIMNPKAASFIVRGIFEENAVSLVWGEPAVGKSHVVYSLAAAVAVGKPWFDRLTKQGMVIIIAGEGHNGIARRFAAIQKKHGYDLTNAPLYVSTRAARLMDELNAMEIAAEIRRIADEIGQKPVLVVIDTMARNMGDGDENSAKDIGAFFSNIDEHIRSIWQCHVCVVHHSPHGQERARGSTAIKGVLDQEFGVTGAAGRLTFSCTKMKDADIPPKMEFKIHAETLGEDEDGFPITGATIVLNDDRFSVEVSKTKDNKPVSARDVLRLMLHEFPGYPAVIASCNLTNEKAGQRAMYQLEQLGMVRRKGAKSWEITDEAKNDISQMGGYTPGIEW